MPYLKYWELPTAIQKQVDSFSEFLEGVTKSKSLDNGQPVYIFHFRDSFEEWFRYFNEEGEQIGHSPFYEKVKPYTPSIEE